MVRGAIFVLLLGFGLVFGTYYMGGISSYDPTEQGLAAKAAVETGMSWEEVLDGAGNPMRFQPVNVDKQKVDGEWVEYESLGPKVRYQSDLTPNDLANGRYDRGFVFLYEFSAQAAFAVTFGADGKVTSIEDVMTAADLLDMRG